jgi:ssDNA-binding replication factor A large subunit
MFLSDLRPGMEYVNLRVLIKKIEDERIITTYSGLEHRIVEGEIQDKSGSMSLTVWNERINDFRVVKPEDKLELVNCFITSFKGVLSVNVGRDSKVMIIE